MGPKPVSFTKMFCCTKFPLKTSQETWRDQDNSIGKFFGSGVVPVYLKGHLSPHLVWIIFTSFVVTYSSVSSQFTIKIGYFLPLSAFFDRLGQQNPGMLYTIESRILWSFSKCRFWVLNVTSKFYILQTFFCIAGTNLFAISYCQLMHAKDVIDFL